MATKTTKQQTPAATKPATKAPVTPTATATAPATNAKATKPQPQQVLPNNVYALPAGRSNKTVVCHPGTVYGVSMQHGEEQVVLPFTLPPHVKEQVQVVIAGSPAAWLGRDGAPQNLTVCVNKVLPCSGVVLRPHSKQDAWLLNAYLPTPGQRIQAVVL